VRGKRRGGGGGTEMGMYQEQRGGRFYFFIANSAQVSSPDNSFLMPHVCRITSNEQFNLTCISNPRPCHASVSTPVRASDMLQLMIQKLYIPCNIS
jgi:hypothetical protein